MYAFVMTLVLIIGLEALAKIICLGRGFIPERKKETMAWDAILGIGFVIWGAVLLCRA